MLAALTLALGMLLAQADCCEIYIHLDSQWIDAGRLGPSRSELPFDFISPSPDSNADQSQIQCDEHGRSCTTIIPSVDIPGRQWYLLKGSTGLHTAGWRKALPVTSERMASKPH